MVYSSDGESSDDDDDDDDDINDYFGALPTAADAADQEDQDNVVDVRIPGAEHLLVLLDCSPDMFVPSVPIKSKHKRHFEYEEEEEDDDDVSMQDDETNGNNIDSQKSGNSNKKLMSPVDAVITSLQELVRQTVRNSVISKSGKRNGFGLTLFGTKKRSRLPMWQDLYRGRHHHHTTNNNTSETNDDDDSDSEDDEDGSDDSNDDNNRAEKANRSSSETTVHTVIPLEPPGILTIKSLRQCLEDPNHNNERRLDLQEEFADMSINDHKDMDATSDTMEEQQAKTKSPSKKSQQSNYDNNNKGTGGASLLTCLNDISQTFRDAPCVKKPGTNSKMNPNVGDDTKTIWIFTNQDNPCGVSSLVEGNSNEDNNNNNNNKSDGRSPIETPQQEQANILKNTAVDLKENGFRLVVFPLPNHRTLDKRPFFRVETFYDTIAETPANLLNLMRSQKDYELDLNEVLEGHWKTVRKAFDVPLIFPDQIPEPKKKGFDGVKSEITGSTVQDGNVEEEDVKPGATDDDNDVEDKEAKRLQEAKRTGIWLDFFSPVQFQTEPAKVKILREMGLNDENVELERITYLLAKETGERLTVKKSSDTSKEAKEVAAQQPGLERIRTFHKLGKSNYIKITQQELAILKRKSNANSQFKSLVLLGFKKQSSIPFHHNLKSYFVYPNDKVVEGSKEAFAHLHQSMLSKNVVGIGELLTRKTATSRLVSIHAFAEELEEVEDDEGNNEDGGADGDNTPFLEQKFPPGWIVSILPFEDDLRSMPVDESMEDDFEVSQEVLAATENLVKEMFGQECDLARYVFVVFLCLIFLPVTKFPVADPFPPSSHRS